MKLSLDSRTSANMIRGYAPGEIRIGEVTASAPCLVSPTELVLDWPATDPAKLGDEQIARILELGPEVVIVGCAPPVPLPPARVRATLGERRVGVEFMEIGAACRTYNVLAQEERRVVAALFPGLR